jgi:hypothetical protein
MEQAQNMPIYKNSIDLKTVHCLLDCVLPEASHTSSASQISAEVQNGTLWYSDYTGFG